MIKFYRKKPGMKKVLEITEETTKEEFAKFADCKNGRAFLPEGEHFLGAVPTLTTMEIIHHGDFVMKHGIDHFEVFDSEQEILDKYDPIG